VQVDPRRVIAEWSGRALSLRARAGNAVAFTVRITTAAVPLTPLTREEIFTPQFLAFLATARDASRGNTADPAALRARWLERQVRGVELLASREKLMAGLPTYATYFGRDMLVTALMMRPIWRDEMSEFVVASVLRKLSPSGQVSHEEALGGQAVREGAAEYASLVDDHRRAAGEGRHAVADSLLARARAVLGNLRRVRENYHMIDDEYQLPVLAARWLGDPDVAPARKRAFLLDSSDGGGTRLARLVRELGLVARTTDAYAANPVATNLVSFPPRDSSRWASTSWRDSNAGYAGGRYAMDVNAIWVPHALESIGRIFDALRTLGFSFDSLARVMPDLAPGTPLGRYGRDPQSLRAAVDSWRGASRHFLVRLSPGELQSFAAARLAAMPGEERDHWRRVLATTTADRDSLTFLALSLDAQGRPIGVANTDGATRLFLGDDESGRGGADSAAAVAVLRDVRLFTLPYPIGLLVDGVGPVVANDAYAPSAVWREFVKDPYHGPRVVWGREVNLFLLGVAHRIAGTSASSGEASRPANPALAAHERTLRAAIERVQAAVQASGFRSELWSYKFRGGRPVAVRYGSGGDVQLWSTTDLVVQFMLSQVSR
jgi:predicted pyridoxine 5'-phosphate oxidase superfamily flavin-nucleotide-binding protein